MSPSALDRIGTTLDEVRTNEAGGADARIVAVAWATVELDRAADELAAELGLTADAFEPADDSAVLGARCRLVRDALADGRSLAIVEPATEGRLAEWLARNGEGPVAIWFTARATEPGATEPGATRPGPFGPERLASPRPSEPSRCWLLTVSEAGTIDA